VGGTHAPGTLTGWNVIVPGIEDVFARLANDEQFAQALRLDPASTLREYALSASDLVRLERALGGSTEPTSLLGVRPLPPPQ
jgi:hypothetical protein